MVNTIHEKEEVSRLSSIDIMNIPYLYLKRHRWAPFHKIYFYQKDV